jgi:hypothetical protein
MRSGTVLCTIRRPVEVPVTDRPANGQGYRPLPSWRSVLTLA